MRYYDLNEVKDLLKKRTHLVFADNGIDEVLIRYEDIPDFIVDVNRNIEMCDLKFYDNNNLTMEPIVTCSGEFLDHCDPIVRSDIIDRLVGLQTNEMELKNYKVIDEITFEEAQNSLSNSKKARER